jgi:protein PhnA
MTCPLCAAATDALIDTPVEGGPFGASVQICEECVTQLSAPNLNHFRGLATTMWSEVPEVQVLAARTLTKLSDEGWARDLSDQLYLDDETRAWAENVAPDLGHKDSNAVPLFAGDTVVLIKD